MDEEQRRRAMVDLAVEGATKAVEDSFSAGEMRAESVEDIGERMFQVIRASLRGFGIIDITRREVREALQRRAASHRAQADQHGAMADLDIRAGAEIERAAALEGVSADELTVGEAVEIIRRHGEEPNPVVLAGLDAWEEVPEERGEEDDA